MKKSSKVETPTPRPRGFAAMTPEQQKAIASLGGRAAHARGTAHQFSPEEAREAGRKGGRRSAEARAQARAAERTREAS